MAHSRDEIQVFDNESEILLGLLTAVEKDSAVTQRSVAKELGIALGLTNSYLKRCIKKGWIKVQQIPANRYAYYLTPKGFSEKSRLAGEYLTQGFRFFRIARTECQDIFATCANAGLHRLAVHGLTDMAEIAVLCANEYPLEIVLIFDPNTPLKDYAGIPIVANRSAALRRADRHFDAIVITDLGDPQASFDALAAQFPAERIFAPPILRVDRAGRGRNGTSGR